MRSHTFYIACAYLALALGLAWEIWDLRRQRRRVIERERESADEAALDASHPETLG